MCFFKKTNKKIQELNEKVVELTSFIKNEEFKKAKKDSDELELKNKLLDLIKFRVNKIRTIKNEEDEAYYVRIKYEIPDVVIKFDENNLPLKNDLFYAINYLELISMEDFVKINEEFHEIKHKRKESENGIK